MANFTNEVLTFVDTSIMVAAMDANRNEHPVVQQRIQALRFEGKLVIAKQCLYEFYAVATRPYSANGLQLTIPAALNKLEELENSFQLVSDPDNLLFLWKQTVGVYGVSGKTAHDARLVAWMLGNSIKRIYTLNTLDFQRYENQLVLV